MISMAYSNKYICFILLSLFCCDGNMTRGGSRVSLLEEQLGVTFKEHIIIFNLDDCSTCVANFKGFEEYLPKDGSITIVLVSQSIKKARLFADVIGYDVHIDQNWYSKKFDLINGPAVIYTENKKYQNYDSTSIFSKEDLLDFFH